MKKFKILVLIIAGLFFITSCSSKDDDEVNEPTNENLVTQVITQQGGTINAPDGIQVVFPQNSVISNNEVTVGYTGTEPTNFGNNAFSTIGKPFTIKMDYSKLSESGMKIILNAPNNFDPNKSIAFCSANPLLPLKFNFNSVTNKIEIFFDKVGNSIYNQLDSYSSYVFGFVVNMQFANQNEFGFKQVSINNNVVSLNTLSTINPNDKILLLVHGWTDAPTDCWSSFIKKISPQITQANYNKIVTFGYYSGLSINSNGQLLASFLNSLPSGVNVDIVGHSMGGLVSRSALENYNASAHVKNLITLGTPHKGSLGGYLKNAIGLFVKLQYGNNPSLIGSFNTGSQGFEDLQNTSQFITDLNNLNTNPKPANVNYYPIAAVYNQNQNYSNLAGITISTINQQPMVNGIVQSVLNGSDGIVARSSALGIQGNNNLSLGATFEIFKAIPHSSMTDDDAVIAHVASKLNEYNIQSPITTNGLKVHYPLNGNLNDASGNGNHTSLSNITFSNDRKSIPNSSIFNDNIYWWGFGSLGSNGMDLTNGFTISLWIKRLNFTGNQQTIFYANGNNAINNVNSYIGIYLTNTGELFCQWKKYIGTNPTTNNINGGNIVDNNWHHLVVQYDNSKVSIIIDNVVKNNISSIGDITNSSGKFTLFNIGQSAITGYGNGFNGNIDDFRIYNRALSQSEITTLYNE